MARPADPEYQLASFLAKYSTEVSDLAESLRGRLRKLYPTALELVYDNYNALAIGYSPSERASEAIFSIALYPKWVSFFFLQARGLSDPERLLQGSGTVCKHVVMTSPGDLNIPAVTDLRLQALEIAKVPFAPQGDHRLIIKSVSAKQRPRRPAAKGVPRPSSAWAGREANAATSAIKAKRASSSTRANSATSR
jgi:hypothetical protein